jgi:hypothetical protein
MKAFHRSVNSGDSPELKRRDMLGKILVEDVAISRNASDPQLKCMTQADL